MEDGTEYKVYDDNFNLVETKTVQYHAVAPTVASSGYIVLPASVFVGLATVQALYITLPAASEAQIGVTELHFGSVGYYTQESPNLAQDMTVLTDFSTWTEAWFSGRITDANGVQVDIVGKETVEETPTEARQSQIDGIALTQKGATGGGVMLEQHALSTLDLSAATYLAIRYYNPTGAAWPFYFIAQQNGGFL